MAMKQIGNPYMVCERLAQLMEKFIENIKQIKAEPNCQGKIKKNVIITAMDHNNSTHCKKLK